MNLQQIVQRRICWGIYATFLAIALQPGISWADEEGERERLNLYDRNRRNIRWEHERKDYFDGYNSSRGRGRSYHGEYYNSYRPRQYYRGAIEEPDMAPPESI